MKKDTIYRNIYELLSDINNIKGLIASMTMQLCEDEIIKYERCNELRKKLAIHFNITEEEYQSLTLEEKTERSYQIIRKRNTEKLNEKEEKLEQYKSYLTLQEREKLESRLLMKSLVQL